MTTTPAANPVHRWAVLAVVSAAQLMVVLDGSVVNIALPAAQADLGMSDVARQWIVTAYGLAFGGLLLAGGRVSDRWGQRRAFLIGLVGFAIASAIGGLALNTEMLIAARALQGIFAALLAPSVLSTLSLTFPAGRERATAFGVFASVAAGGGAIGLLLGGVLTESLSWRWTLLVNDVIAVVVLIAALAVLPRGTHAGKSGRIDIPGAVLVTLGVASLVYGFTNAELSGWTSLPTLGLFAAAMVLLGAFVLLEARVRNPLLPLRVLTDRARGGAYLALAFSIAAMFGQFLLMTYYFQIIERYSPIQAGLAFLPLTVCLVIGSTQIGARLSGRVSPRAIMVTGYVIAASGFAVLGTVTLHSTYWHVLPGTILLGLGVGMAGVAANAFGTSGVERHDAGVASAMVNTSQQLGGAVGTALLATIAASVTAAAGGTDATAADTMQGYIAAFWVAAGIMAAAAVLSALLIRPDDTRSESADDVPTAVQAG